MTLVFDASPLIAYAKQEPGASVVASLLGDDSTPRLVHVVNLCEVYYYFLKRQDERGGERLLRTLTAVGVVSRDDLDSEFWRTVARIKADIQRVSLGDCFVIALAQRVGGTVVTADHGEFDLVATRSICPVLFIR